MDSLFRPAALAAWIVLLGTVATVLVGQDTRWERVRGAYAPDVLAQMEALLEDARARGVPEGPVLDKALEGAAKGVPAGQVVPALAGYVDLLHQAGELTGAPGDAARVVAAADALRRGVPPEAVRQVGPAEQGPVALVVLGDLLDAGLPVGHALSVVERALARGAPAQEMLGMPAAVRRLIDEGIIPEHAAARLEEAFTKGRGPPALFPDGFPGKGKGPPVPPGAGPPPGKGKGKGKSGPP